MHVLIGGVVATVMGLVGLILWKADFLIVVRGAIPIIALLGGVLAIYVGLDEIRDQLHEKNDLHREHTLKQKELDKTKEELAQSRAETAQLKSELKKTQQDD